MRLFYSCLVSESSVFIIFDWYVGFAIRYFNHASFGLGIPDQPDGVVNHDFMAEVINHASLHYTLGMRGYYLAIPFGLWIFGPTWMLIGTMLLVLVLNRLDRTA